MSAVLFEVELAFEGVVDGLDGLPERFEESGARALGFVLAGRSEQAQPGLGERGFEVAGEAIHSRPRDYPQPTQTPSNDPFRNSQSGRGTPLR